MANVDNLNFKVILDDTEFNAKVKRDIKLAQDLNTRLSNLLQIKARLTSLSAQDAASAKRQSDVLAKQAIDQERIKKAAAQTALEEEKVRTQAAKTAVEMQKITQAAANAALAQQRVATEAQRTAAATNQASLNAQRLRTETQRTATETQRTATATQNTANATARAELAQRRLRDYSSQTTRQVQSQSRLMNELKGYVLGYLSIHGATQLLSSLVRVTGEFELQKTTLAAMLGDLNKAEQVIGRIQALAIESPFQFKELTTYAKQLSAFSVPAEELFETTKMLADISAGLGVGMDRIVLAYGQVRSAAFLRGQEVRQFTEAGIPILDELAKQFSELEGRAVSTGEVFDKISARLVPFEMVAKVLKDLTSEGGKFYNMQEVQAETLRGKISNLKDAYEVMLNEIGSQRSGSMKGAVDSVRRLMQNWEKVGAILKTVIVTYGAYRATLGAIWAIEKAIGAIRSVQLYQLLTTERNVKKVTAAYRVFGLTLKQIKKMGAGLAVGAILGLVTVISTAIRRAGELKRELESIMNSEVSGSSKMLRDLDRLVSNLSEAKKGSQNYREAISELNRKYGEYLPNILTEADNYEKVKAAADSAAQAIRNKAKASAFEKGSAAIEDDFGKKLTKSEKALREALEQLDPSLGGEYATEFMQNFKVALAKEGGNLDVLKTFKESFDAYFGEGTYEKFTAKYLKPAALEDAATGYANILRKVQKEEKKLEEQLKLRFSGSEFTSKEEREKMSELNTWYKNQVDNLKELELKQADYNERLESLKIEKLKRLVTIYDELGRPELAKQFQSQLDALTKIPEGWRGTVQGVLKGMGLNKGTSFGLWAEDTTQSTSYVEDMIKRYKELGEEIKWGSSFDTDQAERLKKNKEAIEAIAKALKIDIKNLAANDSDTWESKEEKRIKRLIETLRKLQDNYDRLKALGVSDDSIKTLFEGLYPELIKENGKDFVTDLKYLERAIDLVEDLEKYAPEDAKKILVDLGGEEFSQYLTKLKEQIKGYKESAKAAGEYYNTLRKWATEDFNIDGEGITLDVSKIASDLNGKIREIELRATKARELFAQIDVDSDEEIAKVKEIFVKEFGADAWTDFWTSYQQDGIKAIENLADKQKEYEKKLAQEKVNDLAEKYVKESYFDNNIKLTDLGDKNFFQLRELRKKLQDLLEKEPLTIPTEIVSALSGEGLDAKNLANADLTAFFKSMSEAGQPISEANQELLTLIQNIQKAGLNTEKFGETIKQIFKGDLKELSSEQMQALGELGQMVGEQILSIASALSELGQASGNSQLEALGNQISDLGDAVNNIAQGFKSGGWIGGLIAGIGSLATKVVRGMAEAEQATQNAAEKAIEYAARIKEIEFDNLMKSSETIFGVDEYQKMIDAAKEVVKYQEEVQKNVDAIGVSKQDKFDFMQGMSGWATFSKGAQEAAKMVEDLGLGDILVDERSGWQKFWGTGNDLVKVFNINDFIDADENLMGEELRNLVNQYGDDMSDETKNAINKTLKEWDLYVKSMEQVTSYLTDMFGQVADQMADSFVTAFKETGQAALETESIMDEVSTNIAKSVVKSMIVQNVFKPEDIEKISSYVIAGDTAQALAETDKLLANAEGLYPMIQKYLEGISEYFQMGEDMGSQSLGDGIKGITEDTANILASYLNAIRADVSYARTIWERMDATTQRIASILAEFSAPSLMEYQAQIAANTYNTMIATQGILSKLDAVVTYSDGPAGVRVYS